MTKSNVRPAWWLNAGAVMPKVEWAYVQERYLDLDVNDVVQVVFDCYPILQVTPMRRRLKGGHTGTYCIKYDMTVPRPVKIADLFKDEDMCLFDIGEDPESIVDYDRNIDSYDYPFVLSIDCMHNEWLDYKRELFRTS